MGLSLTLWAPRWSSKDVNSKFELKWSSRLGCMKKFCTVHGSCLCLIMVTLTRHVFINIFHTEHFSDVKFAMGYEKNMSFLVIAKKFEKKNEKIGLGSFKKLWRSPNIPCFLWSENIRLLYTQNLWFVVSNTSSGLQYFILSRPTLPYWCPRQEKNGKTGRSLPGNPTLLARNFTDKEKNHRKIECKIIKENRDYEQGKKSEMIKVNMRKICIVLLNKNRKMSLEYIYCVYFLIKSPIK